MKLRIDKFCVHPPKYEFSNAYKPNLKYLLQFIVRVHHNMFGILFLEHSWHPFDKNIFSDYLKTRAP